MALPSPRQLGAAVFLIAVWMMAAPPVHALAETVASAACYVFAGSRQCETVTIDDPDNCVLKVLPRPLAKLEPGFSACLFDDIGTTKIFLRKVVGQSLMVSNASIRITGRAAVQVMTKFGENGAPPGEKEPVIGAKEAYRRAAEGSLLLIDIRHKTEWRSTGVGVHAISITMHQKIKSFFKQLRAAVNANMAEAGKKKPIALICAEGVRSAFLQRTL